ncbi:MAG: FtsX-like permease family protein, partial [Cyclobacteriaceae bacterium]
MIKNYIKIGFRSILRHRAFSFINIFGLAVALSVCMLIIMMLADQKSYDQYNSNIDRVYRLISLKNPGDTPYATSAFSTGEKLKEDYGLFEEITTLRKGVGGDISTNQKTVEVRGYFADNAFFKVLDRQLILGDEKTALSEPGSIVISQDKAYMLFNTENPIGKIIEMEDRGLDFTGSGGIGKSEDWGSYKITGIIDNKSIKSHVKFDALISSSTLERLVADKLIRDHRNQWDNFYSTYHYVLLNLDKTQKELDEALNEFSQRVYNNLENFENFRLVSQSLGEVTPGIMINNETTIKFPGFIYYIFSVLAFVIILMACLNYTNLSVARSLKRLKEIGVRKVNGALRTDLFIQFLTESILNAVLAMGLALILIYFMKEAFMDLWINKYLDFDLTSSPAVYLYFFLFTLIIGIVAGIYPSLYLSRQKPIGALKNNFGKLKSRWGMQQILSVAQFSVSLIFIVSALVIYSQFRHYINFEYGFSPENIINIPMQSNDPDMLSAEFEKVAGVSDVSFCEYVPATGTSNIIGLQYPG